MGYFTAAVCCGLASYFWLDRTLRDLLYLTFASAISASARE
jgi:phage shock protein PspC (stress-responsive transcriptional regulator)